MDNFIVSARKYRPSTFNSVVGQSSLTTTLKNAIKINHLAHAYLFCGPRGVGKTTCARIFAKTINCQQLTADSEACNECESCVSFNEQRSFNIHELDAASNNSVDDIRSLIEQVRIPPQIGKYSVYIVDEVHMLSPGAFNAFLKTLEEPPAHAIFILATTEKHKIIPTILSRCQIYDFNRITVADTVSHLQYVAKSENVTVDLNGLNVIAQKSDGGMRDALSIFDQLVSFCGSNITYQGVIENLNVLDYEYYFNLVESFLIGNVSNSLLIFNDVLNKGFDAHHFITGLSMHLRDVLVSKDESTLQLLEVGADIGNRYKLQAQQCNNDFLYQALKISNDCDLSYRISKNKRLLVELTLIKICQINIQKKNDFLNENGTQTIKEIIVQRNEPVKSVQPQVVYVSNSANNQSVNSVSASVVEKPDNKPEIATPTPTPKPQAVNSLQRPVSISISRTNSVASPDSPAYEQASPPKIVENKSFTDQDLLDSWNAFGETIQDEIKKIGFLNTNYPKRISETEFEVLVNNVMQSNELKKIQLDINTFMINRLSNTQIKMTIKVAEENEIQRTLSPEEKYKIMSEINPELEKMRKNLNLEID